MGEMAYIHSLKTFGVHAEAFGTIIQENIQGKEGVTAAMLRLAITTDTTAHTASFMYAEGTGTRFVTTAAAAAAQKDMAASIAPKDPAGNAAAASDVIAYVVTGGAWEFNTVASLAVLVITLTTNIAVAVLSGAKVRIFGIIADGAVMTLTCTASVTNTWSDNGEPIIVCPTVGDPMVMQIDNATAASVLDDMLCGWINRSAE